MPNQATARRGVCRGRPCANPSSIASSSATLPTLPCALSSQWKPGGASGDEPFLASEPEQGQGQDHGVVGRALCDDDDACGPNRRGSQLAAMVSSLSQHAVNH